MEKHKLNNFLKSNECQLQEPDAQYLFFNSSSKKPADGKSSAGFCLFVFIFFEMKLRIRASFQTPHP